MRRWITRLDRFFLSGTVFATAAIHKGYRKIGRAPLQKRKRIKFTAEAEVQNLIEEAETLRRRIAAASAEEICWMHDRLHMAVDMLTNRFPTSPLLRQAKLLKLRFKEHKEPLRSQSRMEDAIPEPVAPMSEAPDFNQAA